MKTKESIIGKPYIASDNSYLVNLSYPSRNVRLAGTSIEDPKLAKILTDPYKVNIRTDIHRDIGVNHTFIQVEYKGDTIRVLYQPHNITDDLVNRIKTKNNLQNDLNDIL